MPTTFHVKSRRSAVSPSSLTKRRATLPNPIRTSVSSGWFMRGGCSGRCAGRRLAAAAPADSLQPIEAGAVVLRRLAEAEAQVAVHAEMIAGHDQHALLLAQPVDQRRRIDRVVVADVDDRAGFRLDPAEAAGVGEPRLDQRQVAAQDVARALEQLRAALGLQRDAREAIAERAGRDRHVVVVRPERRDQRRRADDPADAQAREAVRLRQAAGDDRRSASAPTSTRFRRRRSPRRDRPRPTGSTRRAGRRCARCRRDRLRSAARRSGCSDCR